MHMFVLACGVCVSVSELASCSSNFYTPKYPGTDDALVKNCTSCAQIDPYVNWFRLNREVRYPGHGLRLNQFGSNKVLAIVCL
jgi:hypothetical protein